ncbi:hypothetical protein CHLNCDRAFT_35163 [Chlorella variabilis]|uniref:Palmitoyl-protein thioesterase 1 n=1 Tax=Chlorella variabilis TaxID=554065 RepID=E1ZDG9_CHLVA|nr:hypothetical protein CHLNCDRAFT_35163 [Chlorella variabilis]EFN56412.1 hypothetical protein CHLNCDRAFT_35163 [Chlorella variabilis]|eukprot:XP_005848514.1 hypothetical protein CHLNCDRAFT_35163 [Chlorella variabilis]
MGDSCCSEHSMGAVADSIRQALPGTYVHSIATGQGESADVLSSYFGSVNAQVAAVCDELLGMQELKDGFVAVGFSQGGQFLRAVAQRCQHLGPSMHSLVTVGAQHQGVMAVPGCLQGGDANSTLYCRIMQGLIGRGAYSWLVQGHVVQAQYVKDPWHLDLYLQRSLFLADLNNEVAAARKRRYHDNLASLHRLVLFQFDADEMVVPKESSHFGFFNGSHLVPLREQPLYAQDWLGLRALDEAGRLELLHAPGAHMRFSLAWFQQAVVVPYLAVPAPAAAAGAAAGAASRR